MAARFLALAPEWQCSTLSHDTHATSQRYSACAFWLRQHPSRFYLRFAACCNSRNSSLHLASAAAGVCQHDAATTSDCSSSPAACLFALLRSRSRALRQFLLCACAAAVTQRQQQHDGDIGFGDAAAAAVLLCVCAATMAAAQRRYRFGRQQLSSNSFSSFSSATSAFGNLAAVASALRKSATRVMVPAWRQRG
jgi:hypothetical protein